jgi:hypothetical protein
MSMTQIAKRGRGFGVRARIRLWSWPAAPGSRRFMGTFR